MEKVLNESSPISIERYGSPSPAPAGNAASGSGLVQDLLEIVRRRKRMLIGITLAVFIPLAALIMMLTPRFEGLAKIQIDPGKDAIVAAGSGPISTMVDQGVIDTEVAIIQSRDVARAVVDKLRLDLDPDVTRGIDPPTDLTQQNVQVWKDAVADSVLRKLKVERERGTYVVGVSYRALNPAQAANVANAFAQAYIQKGLQSRTGVASEQADFLNKRLEEEGAKLNEKDREVAQYKAQAGVMAGGLGAGAFAGTVTDQLVAPLTAQVANAEAVAAAARARVSEARAQLASGSLNSVSGVLNSTVVMGLRAQQAELQKNQGDLKTLYGPNHPYTIKNTEQLRMVDQQIDEEGRRIVKGLESDAAAATAQEQVLRARLAELRGQQAANTKASVMANSLELQASTQRETYNRLAAQQQAVDQVAGYSGKQARIVEAATIPERPASPNKPLLLAVSLILALAAGAGTITAQELMSTGLRTASDVERKLGIPFIVSVPALKTKGRFGRRSEETESPADTIIDLPVSPFAEAFRIARSTLLLNETVVSPRVISIMSTVPDEGKTTSSLAMARVLATSGERVLLIDCDLRQNGLSRIVGDDGRPGIVELLGGRASLQQVIRKDRAPNLDIIPIPQAVFTSQDVFGGDTMARLLRHLREDQKYDRIVLDTPPLLGVADARTLASLSDAAILLIRWNHTNVSAIKSGLAWLEADRAPLIGAMFTMVDPKSEAIGAMYYSRKYAKYYQSRAA